MRTETTSRTLYKFAELSEDAQQAALDACRDFEVRYDWWDFVYEDAKQCGGILGIDIDRIYFSGFWSQGDGACYTGSYRYAPGAVKAIAEHAPKDAELAGIARALRDVQRPAFYTARASMRQRGHYSHSGCMSVDGDAERGTLDHDALTQALREFADWIYSQLEREHTWRTADEQVRECIDANEYEFTESGKLA
jgi:hypothetical protein